MRAGALVAAARCSALDTCAVRGRRGGTRRFTCNYWRARTVPWGGGARNLADLPLRLAHRTQQRLAMATHHHRRTSDDEAVEEGLWVAHHRVAADALDVARRVAVLARPIPTPSACMVVSVGCIVGAARRPQIRSERVSIGVQQQRSWREGPALPAAAAADALSRLEPCQRFKLRCGRGRVLCTEPSACVGRTHAIFETTLRAAETPHECRCVALALAVNPVARVQEELNNLDEPGRCEVGGQVAGIERCPGAAASDDGLQKGQAHVARERVLQRRRHLLLQQREIVRGARVVAQQVLQPLRAPPPEWRDAARESADEHLLLRLVAVSQHLPVRSLCLGAPSIEEKRLDPRSHRARRAPRRDVLEHRQQLRVVHQGTARVGSQLDTA
eukprot:5474766-Prymnesium_polylepis.1